MHMALLCLIGIIPYVQNVGQSEKSPRNRSATLKRSYLDCAEQTNVDPERVLELRNGFWRDDERLKDWVHCVLVKNDIMTNQSVLQLDVALNEVSQEERDSLEEIIDKCILETAHPPKDIAWHFAKCYHKNALNHSLF